MRWSWISSQILCLNALFSTESKWGIFWEKCQSFRFWEPFYAQFPPHFLPYLSSQMFTGYHPLFTDSNTRSQVLSHRYKCFVKYFKTAQLPLHISSQGSTLSMYTQIESELPTQMQIQKNYTCTHSHSTIAKPLFSWWQVSALSQHY